MVEYRIILNKYGKYCIHQRVLWFFWPPAIAMFRQDVADGWEFTFEPVVCDTYEDAKTAIIEMVRPQIKRRFDRGFESLSRDTRTLNEYGFDINRIAATMHYDGTFDLDTFLAATVKPDAA